MTESPATPTAPGAASGTNPNSTDDINKPPDYNDALAYRKSEIQDEGYPEPSLVDGPQPPSYDALY